MAAGSLDTIVTEWIELPMTLDKSLWIDPWEGGCRALVPPCWFHGWDKALVESSRHHPSARGLLMPGSTVRAGASVLTLVLLLLIGACSTPVTEPPATWTSEATDSTPTATAIPPTSTLNPDCHCHPANAYSRPDCHCRPADTLLSPRLPRRSRRRPTPAPTATAVPPTPTLTPTATAIPPTPTLTPTATAVPPTPTLTPTATAIPPTSTPTSTPTPTPTPTPTQIPGRKPTCIEEVAPPEHMAYIWWGWTQAQDDRGFEELEVAFTVHNDVGDMPGLDGLYLMVCYGKIAETPFYFGIQTNAHSATRPLYGRGKAAIFSRWETRDLELARFSEKDGWTQSSGHEGDFIGVRRSYDWGPGEDIARPGARRRGPGRRVVRAVDYRPAHRGRDLDRVNEVPEGEGRGQDTRPGLLDDGGVRRDADTPD